MVEETLLHPLIERQGEPLLAPSDSGRSKMHTIQSLDWRQGAGAALVVAGLIAVMGAWIGVSGTSATAPQLAYMTSGGLGGMVLVAAGIIFFSAYEHRRDRQAMGELTERLLQLEDGLAGEFDHLYTAIETGKRPAFADRDSRAR